jgi:hypothetical protein
MNMAAHGLAQNARHRDDELLGIWYRSGKGSSISHSNYEGWTISKARGGAGWVIAKPDGIRADRFVWQTLSVAKYQVDEYTADAARKASR